MKKGHKDLESEDKQIMFDMIKCRLARELQREGWQAGKANALCSRKNVHEQGEIGFVKASISHVVTGIETHSNDSLKRACEPQGGTQMAVLRLCGNKWQELDTAWRHEPRETSEPTVTSTAE